MPQRGLIMEINIKEINYLAKTYSPLDYSSKLAALLSKVYPYLSLESLSRFDLHCLLNETLLSKYRGEQIYKYELFQRHLNKKLVAAFEIKINNSRLDFLTIGSHTTSFEIKSELDNLSKLSKQTADYQLAFEYNYLIVDKCHVQKVLNIIPDCFGLWSFNDGEYKKVKVASKSDKIDPFTQLKLLNKKELTTHFPDVDGCKHRIVCEFESEIINQKFKEALVSRYKKRWDFVTLHQKSIMPIDIQFFFNTNIQPQFVYH